MSPLSRTTALIVSLAFAACGDSAPSGHGGDQATGGVGATTGNSQGGADGGGGSPTPSGGQGGFGGTSTGDGGAGGETRPLGGAGGEATTTSSCGGAGGGHATLCTPGDDEPCYSGPPGTEGQGTCVAGLHTCAADGASFGPCVGDVVPASESCAAIEDLDCDGVVTTSCTGDYLWGEVFGSSSNEFLQHILTDSAGNILIAGRYNGIINFGGSNLSSAGSTDIYVAKLDAAGNHLWSKRFGGAGQQILGGIAFDATGNIVIGGSFDGSVDWGGGSMTGSTGGDAFVLKLDPLGNHIWSKRFVDSPNTTISSVSAVATDATGGIFLTGRFEGTLDVGGGAFTCPDANPDGFVVKLDAAGDHLWSKHISANQDQMGDVITTDPAGNVYVHGRLYAETVDLGGGPFNAGAFVVKYDPAGNFEWQYSIDQEIRGMVIDGAGDLVATGYFPGTIDFGGGPLVSGGGEDVFLFKLDAYGNHIWSQRFGGSNDQLSRGLVTDSDDNIVIFGDFKGTVSFGSGLFINTLDANSDVFAAKFDTDGSPLWSKHFGNDEGQLGHAIGVDPTDNLIVSGPFVYDLSFGGPDLSTPTPDAYLYLVKLSP